MAATEEQITRVRRMAAESGDSSPYSDEEIAAYIEAYPLMDNNGLEEGYQSYSNTLHIFVNWTPTYDLNAAAGDIWEEKAALLVANGAIYETDSAHAMAMRQCRYFRSKRALKGVQMRTDYVVLDQNLNEVVFHETTGS